MVVSSMTTENAMSIIYAASEYAASEKIIEVYNDAVIWCIALD